MLAPNLALGLPFRQHDIAFVLHSAHGLFAHFPGTDSGLGGGNQTPEARGCDPGAVAGGFCPMLNGGRYGEGGFRCCCWSGPYPSRCLGQLASVGIQAHSAYDRDIFLEELVPLHVPTNPKTVSSRNERVVVSGFARVARYVAAQQVFHAGDGLGGGVAPSTD
jgi:hypothetical protein